jgi:hypothetical protein
MNEKEERVIENEGKEKVRKAGLTCPLTLFWQRPM